MSLIPISCDCGNFRASLDIATTKCCTRALCYCLDCQMFAHYLGHPERILNSLGGSDVVQVSPARIKFLSGQNELSSIRLTENGMIRWFAQCCRTPIGNTMANPDIPFIGLIHNCIRAPGQVSLDSLFGATPMISFPQFAQGNNKPESNRVKLYIGALSIIRNILVAKIRRESKQNPFIDNLTSTTIVTPRILDKQELESLSEKVNAS